MIHFAPIVAWIHGGGEEFVLAFLGFLLGARVILGIVRSINDRDDPGETLRGAEIRRQRARKRTHPSVSYQFGRAVRRLIIRS